MVNNLQNLKVHHVRRNLNGVAHRHANEGLSLCEALIVLLGKFHIGSMILLLLSAVLKLSIYKMRMYIILTNTSSLKESFKYIYIYKRIYR
jgi:hypothetical protein